MGRRRKRFVEADYLDDYLAKVIYEGLGEAAFDPNRDIFKLDINKKKKETELEFKKRQNRRIKKFIEKYLYIRKDGIKRTIKLIPQQVILIADIFYRRTRNGKLVNKVIIWASRGGGKGVCVSIIMYLLMVYRGRSFVDLAGGKDQALIVYEYTKELWKCIPEVYEKLLTGEPLQSKTVLKNGATLKCVPNSYTQTRGKHPNGLVCDEISQRDPSKDANFKAAMNMVFSETDYLIILLSTFHIPVGLFPDIWDNADKKGFVKYKWDVFDTAQKCTLPYNCIPGDDPDKKDCPLTEKVDEFDNKGNLLGFRYEGCQGKCRNTNGYAPIENLFGAYETNNDDETWKVEFRCERPKTKGPVYNLGNVWKSFIPDKEIEIPKEPDPNEVAIGIDWGWQGQTAVVGPAFRCNGYVAVLHEKYFTRKPAAEVIHYLNMIRKKYGDFVIYPDSSHPFENAQLVEQGFTIWCDKNSRSDTNFGVTFNKWKEWGIGNLRRYFDNQKLRISLDECPDLWQYLKKYRLGPDGKPVKSDDHGPDALLTCMLGHPYIEENLICVDDLMISQKTKKEKVLTFGGKNA